MARAILADIERLKAIRDIGISPETVHRLHQNRLLKVAREAAQTVAYQLKEYEFMNAGGAHDRDCKRL